MANLSEESVWQNGIYQIEKNDAVRGGPLPEGISNLQAKQLADRTNYLKKHTETESASREKTDSELQSQIAALDDQVGDESASREKADDDLQRQISALDDQVKTESTSREDADGELQRQISALDDQVKTESTSRKDADGELQRQISALDDQVKTESTSRGDADGNLQRQISALDDQVGDESTSRKEADGNLQSQITILQGQVKTESTSREKADDELQKAVKAVNNRTTATFIIDSDAALAAWANNTSGNDYSRILIKAGTWTLNTVKSGGYADTPMAIIDISNGRTKSVIGESGSKIVINNAASEMIHLCGIKGKVTETNPNLVNPGGDYFFTNVTIEINNVATYTGQYGALAASYGFYACANLTNCTGTGNSSGAGIAGGASYGFYSCVNLTGCIGIGSGTIGTTGSGSGSGFWGCINLTNCTGTGKGVAGYGTGASCGFYTCANLINCTGTGITSGGNGGYGFYNCRTGFGCKNGPTASTNGPFGSCYMEQLTGTTYPWANTAAGGYNLP